MSNTPVIIYQEPLIPNLTGLIIDSKQSGRVISIVRGSEDVIFQLNLGDMTASVPILQRLVNIATQVPQSVFPDDEEDLKLPDEDLEENYF